MRTVSLLSTLFLTACGTPPTADAVPTEGVLTAKSHKVEICHLTSADTTKVLSIASAAVDAHLSHGDHLAGDYYTDGDGDGFGDAAAEPTTCKVDPTDVTDATDCNDGDLDINPDAEEVCGDGVDNDCDGEIDEGCASACPCAGVLDMESFYDATDGSTYCAIDWDRFGPVIDAFTMEKNEAMRTTSLGQVAAFDWRGTDFESREGSYTCAYVQMTFDPETREPLTEEQAHETFLSREEYEACVTDVGTYIDAYGCDSTH